MPQAPVNILLVDDQPAKLLTYESILEGMGERLVRASSGDEALHHLLQDDYAVVLLDVVMPELDGFELASLIRSHPRFDRTAILLISAVMIEDAYRLKGYGAGAVDYIPTPIVPEILRAKVSVFVDLYRKSTELERLNQELEQRVAERTAALQAAAAAAIQARQEAERANKIKDEFLATLSHELRTPLNAISGWSQLLLAGALDPADQTKAAETIHRNAMAQARLMADLLDISRIVSGKLRLERLLLDPGAVARAAVDTMQLAASDKGQSIRLHLSPVPAVMGDPVRLQQVIGNLLSNAVKFTPEGGHIDIRLAPSADGRQLAITVSDNGPGIPADFLPHMFERFRQGDASSTRSQRGLGLGLAIVRHLAEAHGGQVVAANRSEGTGAIITVTLPAVADITANAAGLQGNRAATPGAPPAAADSALINALILVVDDEPDAREVVTRLLEGYGADVIAAASAPEAMELLQRRRPQIVLSDIEMPGEDGYSLVQRIRALPAAEGGDTPVVALTAYAGAHDRRRLLAAGFAEHIPKPVDAAELLRRLRLVATLAAHSAGSAE